MSGAAIAFMCFYAVVSIIALAVLIIPGDEGM